MTALGLTPKQAKLLAFIESREVCPSYAEMMAHMKLSSTSGVHRLVHGLYERGRIIARWDWGGNIRPRSIEVVTPVYINGKRYRFIPVHRADLPGATAPAGGAGVKPAGAPDMKG